MRKVKKHHVMLSNKRAARYGVARMQFDQRPDDQTIGDLLAMLLINEGTVWRHEWSAQGSHDAPIAYASDSADIVEALTGLEGEYFVSYVRTPNRLVAHVDVYDTSNQSVWSRSQTPSEEERFEYAA